MSTTITMWLGIAFVVAIIATGIFYGLFVGKLSSTPGNGKTIVVAAKELKAGAVLEASDRRREAAPAQRQMRLLEERLPLVAIVGVREVVGSGAEIAEGRRQAGIVREMEDPGVLHLDDEISVRKERAQAGA